MLDHRPSGSRQARTLAALRTPVRTPVGIPGTVSRRLQSRRCRSRPASGQRMSPGKVHGAEALSQSNVTGWIHPRLLDPAPDERPGRLVLEEDVATFQPPRQQHAVGVLDEGEEGLARPPTHCEAAASNRRSRPKLTPTWSN